MIRHAASLHAEHRLIAGVRSCLGLNAAGEEQARRPADRLRRTCELADCAVLRTSPVPSARKTAEILADALPGVELADDPGLIELEPGDAEGLAYPDYESRFGAFDLMAEPDCPFSPNGESWSAMLARVRSLQDDLVTRYAGKMVVAVTHGGTINASLHATSPFPDPAPAPASSRATPP